MSASTEAAPPVEHGTGWASPFAIFGYVMIVASAYAIFDMSYYAGVPALSSATIGTLSGVVIGVVAFLILGVRAPPNE